MRAPAILTAAAALLLAVTACSSAAPTPIVIYTTATPTASGTPTPLVTPTPTATPTSAPTNTPGPSATPTVAPSPTPGASITPGPAAGCSGKATNQPFWVDTANHVPFTVYCGVVPSPWYFSAASSTYGNSGTVTATYKTSGGAVFMIQEGAFCTIGGSACSSHDTVIGPGHFGDLIGSLDSLGPGMGFAIYVNAGTTHGYTATGTGVSQATFVNLAAALIKVPKS